MSYNPEKVLNLKQIQLGQATIQTPLKSRKRTLSNDLLYLQTPSNQKELQKTIELLQKNEDLSRSVRMILSKIFKSYETLHVIRARDQLRLQGQEVIIDEIFTKRTRKKIAIDPNNKFVRIRDVKETQYQQDVQKAVWALKDRTVEARKTVLETQNKDQQAFMFEFNVIDMQNVDSLL